MRRRDADIEAMNLSDGEKDGLQVFRNYKRSFDAYAEQRFAEEVDSEEFDLEPLRQAIQLLTVEDPRFLPVIVCAYADDRLKEAFRAVLPGDLPGGVSALFRADPPTA